MVGLLLSKVKRDGRGGEATSELGALFDTSGFNIEYWLRVIVKVEKHGETRFRPFP